MKIAVLGGGHGCYAAAADLAEQGHEVRLWRRDRAAFEPVRATGAITLIDHRGARAVPIANATLDIGEALRGAELILVALPATAQEDIARAMHAGKAVYQARQENVDRQLILQAQLKAQQAINGARAISNAYVFGDAAMANVITNINNSPYQTVVVPVVPK